MMVAQRVERGAQGRIPRPRTWQRGLELCIRGIDFERTRTESFNGRTWKKQATDNRPEDFANAYPEDALEHLTSMVLELAEEGDWDGARHWQGLADALGDYLERDTFAPEIDPWHVEPEPPAGDTGKVKTLKAEEIEAFFAAINRRSVSGTRTYALAMLLHHTGMRVGEALALTRRDIDWAEGRVYVRKGKTKSAERAALMPVNPDDLAQLHDALTRWMIKRQGLNPKSDRIFVSGTGERLLYNSVHRSFERVSARAGITPAIHPHQFRHTYASELMGKGANPAGVAAQLGHSSPAVTLRTYTHVAGKEQYAAVAVR